MPKFENGSTASVVELTQLVNDWGYDLDMTGGSNVAALCTEDCDYRVGGTSHRGHDGIRAFYAARNERVRTQQKDGVRTQRHTLSSIRVSFQSEDRADVTFIVVNYSAEGKAPALDLVGPTIIADSRFECRREGREWRIALFDSTPVFIGNDPFLNASVIRK